MAGDQPQNAFCDLRLWAKQQVLRIEALSKQEVLCELQGIMEGHNYSWHYINDLLQARFEEGSLEFSLTDGDVLFEWNNLCHEKKLWEKRRRLSVDMAEFNMDCLINLKILPFQAGLGIEVPRLVTSNMDKANVSTVDLWAGPKDLKSQVTSKLLDDDDTSASDSESSDYVNEYETEDEDFEREDESNKEEIEDYDENSESDEVETEDEEDIEGSDVDVDGDGLGEDESGIEEIEDCDDSSDQSDEVETEDEEDIEGSGVDDESGKEEIDYDDSSDQSDEVETENEDFEGLGVKIVDVDDEYDISDLEL